MIFSPAPLTNTDDWMWAFIPADCKSIRVALTVAKPELAALSLQKVEDAEMPKDLLDFEAKILANSTKIKIGMVYIEKDQVDDENKMFSNSNKNFIYNWKFSFITHSFYYSEHWRVL